MKRALTLLIIGFWSTIIVYAQEIAKSESWSGGITVGTRELNIGFVIKTQPDGKQSCTMDVPDQGAKEIPVELLKNDFDSLNISIPALRASFKGHKVSSEIIEGTFTQNGMSLTLNLKPGGFELKRPQTPVGPFVYTTEEVVFRNDAEGAELSGTLTVSVYPWSNKILKLWGRIIVGRTDVQNEGYKWIGHRLQLMFLAQLNMKKWSCEASYQYPGKVISGHWVRPRAEFMRISGTYRPINNLSIGVSWECPFFKSFHESEYTTSTAPVHKRRDIYATDRANQISLRFQYNFSFGKNQKGVRKKLNNSDTDTGILKK